MKKILIILICILASCSTAKRCEKHIAKAKELGCLKESDSTKIVVKYIKGDTIISYVDVYIDSSDLDTLNKQDTCFTKEWIQTIVQKLKIIPVDKIDSNYKLKIWLDNGKIRYELKLPSRKDSIVYQIKYLEHKPISEKWNNIPKWLVILIGIIGLLFIIKAFRKN